MNPSQEKSTTYGCKISGSPFVKIVIYDHWVGPEGMFVDHGEVGPHICTGSKSMRIFAV
jgi:hypothetical protein